MYKNFNCYFPNGCAVQVKNWYRSNIQNHFYLLKQWWLLVVLLALFLIMKTRIRNSFIFISFDKQIRNSAVQLRRKYFPYWAARPKSEGFKWQKNSNTIGSIQPLLMKLMDKISCFSRCVQSDVCRACEPVQVAKQTLYGWMKWI